MYVNSVLIVKNSISFVKYRKTQDKQTIFFGNNCNSLLVFSYNNNRAGVNDLCFWRAMTF